MRCDPGTRQAFDAHAHAVRIVSNSCCSVRSKYTLSRSIKMARFFNMSLVCVLLIALLMRASAGRGGPSNGRSPEDYRNHSPELLEGGRCPADQPFTTCAVAPCDTQECKDKCAAAAPPGTTVTIACLNNFCGGCKCNCVIAKNTICSTEAPLSSIPCYPGTVCAVSNTCASNPFVASCETKCIPKKDSVAECKKDGYSCDDDKVNCCPGFSCQKASVRGNKRACKTCKKLDTACVPSAGECCPFLACKVAGSGYSCQAA